MGLQLCPQEENSLKNVEKPCVSMSLGYFLLDFYLSIFLYFFSVCGPIIINTNI